MAKLYIRKNYNVGTFTKAYNTRISFVKPTSIRCIRKSAREMDIILSRSHYSKGRDGKIFHFFSPSLHPSNS
ncbi:unnamed protein product [Parnassius mnemosyne]|uniref:Uncharacterized protein n=1 Tax=Parnassius mnemosyne TaxID=213953 RepID=A0AAV1K811_9NEOP